ncbi:MAG TPA: M48 family peptidase, partial [Hellea balneolensis]|nr:M48 family peptidase [Hellea balneolensis]
MMVLDIIVQGFDAAKATEAYLAQITPDARLKSDSYMEGGYWLILWNFLIALIIYWALLASKFTARLRDKMAGKLPN